MTIKKDINLIPEEFKTDKKNFFINITLVAFVLGALVFFMYSFIYLNQQLILAKEENNKVLEEIAWEKNTNEAFIANKKKQMELKEREDVLKIINEEKFKVLEFVNKLSSNLPNGVYISSFAMTEEKNFNISFITVDPIDSVRLIVKLKEMDMFEKLETTTFPMQNNNTVTFNLKLKGLAEATPQKTPPVKKENDTAKEGE